MSDRVETGFPLGRLHRLGDGNGVRLRLARSSDVPLIADLLTREGRDLDRWELARLVHFDPRRRYVVCAAGLVDSIETMLGFGAIELDGGGGAKPDVMVIDERYRAELEDLLTGALVGAATGISRSRVA